MFALLRYARDSVAAILLLIFALVVLFIAPRPTQAYGLGGGDCTHTYGTANAPIVWKGYEHRNFNNDEPNGGRVLCFRTSGSLQISNLKNISSTVPGWPDNCRLQGPASNGTWNDCISSDKWSLDCHQHVELYSAAGYESLWTGYQRYDDGQDVDYPFGFNDSLTGVKVVWVSGGCQ